MRQFDPQNPKSLSLRTHSQTIRLVAHRAGRLQQRRPHLHRGDGRHPRATRSRCTPTPSTRRSRCPPTSRPASPAQPAAAAAGERTTYSIDPWAGSYYVEKLTHGLAERAWAHITEAEAAGGMAAAIEQGIPKMRIEEAARPAPRRASTSGAQKVIGVNTFRLAAEDKLDVLRSTTTRSIASRSPSSSACAPSANQTRWTPHSRRSPTPPSAAVPGGGSLDGNLSPWPSTAARAKATVGEISLALEKVYGRATRR